SAWRSGAAGRWLWLSQHAQDGPGTRGCGADAVHPQYLPTDRWLGPHAGRGGLAREGRPSPPQPQRVLERRRAVWAGADCGQTACGPSATGRRAQTAKEGATTRTSSQRGRAGVVWLAAAADDTPGDGVERGGSAVAVSGQVASRAAVQADETTAQALAAAQHE